MPSQTTQKPPTTTQKTASTPDQPHEIPGSPFNPAADSDFTKRFEAALAKDDAAREAERTTKAPPAKETPKAIAQEPKDEPAQESAVVAEQPKTEESPKQEEPKSTIPEVRRPKTAEANLVEMRKLLESSNARISQLEKELKSKAEVPVEDLAKLKKENEELHERIAAADLSLDPKFQAHYEGQINPAVEEAKGLVPPEQKDRIAEIMQMPVGKERYRLLNEVYTELEPWQADRLREINAHVVKLSQERSHWLAKAKETRQQLMSRQQQEVQASVAEASAALEEQLKNASNNDTGLLGFVPGEGNQDEVNNNVALAKMIFANQLPIKDRAKAAIWAAAAPRLVRELMDRDAKIAELQEAITKLKAAGPDVGGGPTGESTSDQSEDDGNLSYEERVNRRAAKAGVFER